MGYMHVGESTGLASVNLM